MLEALLVALIWIIAIVVVAALVLWAVGKFLPEFAYPASLIVGAIALIAILYVLLRVVAAGLPGLP